MKAAGWHPVLPRDAGMAGHFSIRIVGPLRGVTVEGIRSALRAVHQANPGNRFLREQDTTGKLWRALEPAELEALLPELVTWFPLAQSQTPAELLAWMADRPTTGVPARWVVARDYVGMKVDHTIGDGGYLQRMLAHVVTAAAGGSPVPRDKPELGYPLARALLRIAASPATLGRVARVPRPSRPKGAVPAETWQRGFAGRRAVSRPGLPEYLRNFRHSANIKASINVMMMSAVYEAMRQSGLSMDGDGMNIVVDARRYLRKGAVVDGNFTTGVWIVPRDPADPEAVGDALASALGAARPITALALNSLRRKRSGSAPAEQTMAADPALVFSILHKGGPLERLPWASDEVRDLYWGVSPGRPDELCVSSLELSDRFQLNASFDPGRVDGEKVARALEMVVSDPLALLQISKTATGLNGIGPVPAK